MSHLIHSQAGQLATQRLKSQTLQQSLQEELAVSQERIVKQEKEIQWLKKYVLQLYPALLCCAVLCCAPLHDTLLYSSCGHLSLQSAATTALSTIAPGMGTSTDADPDRYRHIS